MALGRGAGVHSSNSWAFSSGWSVFSGRVMSVSLPERFRRLPREVVEDLGEIGAGVESEVQGNIGDGPLAG